MTDRSNPKPRTETAGSSPPAAPPMPPEGKPFQVGDLTASLETVKPKAGAPTVTLRLKRVLRATPERIYQAFLDPDALAAWLPPHGMMAKTHALDARPGGKFRMSFFTVNKSWTNTFGGTYVELVPNQRIVHTDTFETDDPAMQGEMRVTITLTAVEGGTLVEVVQEGIPQAVAGGSPYGWSQSFEKLALLVETVLPF